MFRYAPIATAILFLIACVTGCASTNSCGCGGHETCDSGCGTGECSSCGGCDSCDRESYYCDCNWFTNLFKKREFACPSCGEVYWGDKDDCCDLCDRCGNYVGYSHGGPAYQQAYGGEMYAHNSVRSEPQYMNYDTQIARAPRVPMERRVAQRAAVEPAASQRTAKIYKRDDQVVRAGAREEIEPQRLADGVQPQRASSQKYPVQATASAPSSRRVRNNAYYDGDNDSSKP